MHAAALPPAVGFLPGGLLTDQGLARDYAFVPADGRLELALGEIATARCSRPQAVSAALVAGLCHLAGGPALPGRVDALCVADRQFLMRQLARHLGDDGGWFTATCGACGSRFDFELRFADLPVRAAGDGYPWAQVHWRGRPLRLRVPNGADQIRLLATPPDAAAGTDPQAAMLAMLLADDGPLTAADLPPLAAPERMQFEAALEAVSPGVCTEVAASCPDCASVSAVDIDPYAVLARPLDGLLDEVHRLASAYHWSEADILSLPRARRQRYLQLIDRQRGLQA